MNETQLLNIGANATISNSFNTQTEDKAEVKTIYKNMMIEFWLTANTQEKQTKAFCYEISAQPIATSITDENLKKIVLDNPYTYRFLVDLEVYKNAEGKILNYRAFNYKDKLSKD